MFAPRITQALVEAITIIDTGVQRMENKEIELMRKEADQKMELERQSREIQ